MSDAAPASPAKKAAAKAKKPKKPAEHPKVQVMVIAAIKGLKERNGSSLQAIKKHIAANNKGVDLVKLNFHIKKCLKTGVEKKVFVQTKGHGASGSFKLAAKAEKPKVEKKKPAAKKAKTPKKAAAKKPAAKKAKTPKKAKKPAGDKAKKPAAAKKPKAAAKKPAAKKPAAKKPAAKKPAAKKPAAKKAAAKK